MNDLLDTLDARARRAPEPTDDLLDGIRERGHQLRQRRRTTLAVAGGAGGVLAIIAAITVVAGVVGGPSATNEQAAGRGTTTPVTRSVTTPPASAPLVTIPAAPRAAPVSVTLMPKGWRYLAHTTGVTVYAPIGTPVARASEFLGKIAIMPHAADGTPLPVSDFPLRVAGLPARYATASDDHRTILISVRWSATITIDFQIAPEAKLDRSSALRLANTLDVRSVSDPSHG